MMAMTMTLIVMMMMLMMMMVMMMMMVATMMMLMLMVIIGFELSEGMRLEHIRGENLSWSQKAWRLIHHTKTLAMTNTIWRNGITVTFKRALRPSSNATSLSPLGAP